MPAPYTAFYDRNLHTILGKFSIRAADGTYIVEKLVARSGIPGYSKTDWIRGKSPVPWGEFNLSTVPNNIGQVAGKTGIGECFPVDNEGDRMTIRNPENKRQRRLEICVHEENAIPGSAGCIVIVFHSDWLRVRDFLRSIQEEHPVIPLKVL